MAGGPGFEPRLTESRVRCSTVELSPTAPATRRLRGAPCGFDARLSGKAAVVKAAPGSVSAPALLRFVALTIRTPISVVGWVKEVFPLHECITHQKRALEEGAAP